jgi:hypothetical protein
LTLDKSSSKHEPISNSTISSETPSLLSSLLTKPLPSSSLLKSLADEHTDVSNIESQLQKTSTIFTVHYEPDETCSMKSFETIVKPVESIDDESPPSLTSPTSMLISQSNHYNYSTRNKQPSTLSSTSQTITINNFNTSTNMTYNFAGAPFPYNYSAAASSIDMQPFYYPSTTSMNYMPYYPTAPYAAPSSPMYPAETMYNSNTTSAQSMYYPSNGVHSIPYNGNGTPTYVYPTAQSSSTASNTRQH